MTALQKNELELSTLKADSMQDMSYVSYPGDDWETNGQQKMAKIKDEKSPQFSSFRF